MPRKAQTKRKIRAVLRARIAGTAAAVKADTYARAKDAGAPIEVAIKCARGRDHRRRGSDLRRDSKGLQPKVPCQSQKKTGKAAARAAAHADSHARKLDKLRNLSPAARRRLRRLASA